MISVPLPKIKEKILENTSMTEEELNKKVQAKLDQLSGLISEEGAAHIIANELGIKLVQTSGKLEIKNILPGMRDVEVVAKVARTYELRNFNTGERSGKVASMMITDGTGNIRVTMWNDQADQIEKIKEGDVVDVKSAYVRDNNGRKELHLNDNSVLEINPSGVKIDVDVTNMGATRKKLSELQETDEGVEVLATIVQVFEPKFFEVCPGCSKRARPNETGFACETHGNVKEPDYAYVMNVYLDDGTDNVRTVLWRRQVQGLLGMKDEEIVKFKDSPLEFEPIKNDLLGNIVKVTGRVKKNEAFDRLEFVASYVQKNPDPEQEIQKLKEEAEKVTETPKEETKEEPQVKEEVKEAPVEETTTKVETKVTAKETPKEETTVTEEDIDEFEVNDDDLVSIDDL